MRFMCVTQYFLSPRSCYKLCQCSDLTIPTVLSVAAPKTMGHSFNHGQQTLYILKSAGWCTIAAWRYLFECVCVCLCVCGCVCLCSVRTVIACSCVKEESVMSGGDRGKKDEDVGVHVYLCGRECEEFH